MSFTHPIEPLPEGTSGHEEPLGFDEPDSREDIDSDINPSDATEVDPKDYPEADPAI